MIRSVYCPSDELLDEATKIANDFKLPIIIGECKQISSVNFDRSNVCVIEVPDAHFLYVSDSEIRSGLAQAFEYVNDFINLQEVIIECFVSIDDSVEQIAHQYIEKHRVRYVHRSLLIGKHTISISISGNVITETEYEVVE